MEQNPFTKEFLTSEVIVEKIIERRKNEFGENNIVSDLCDSIYELTSNTQLPSLKNKLIELRNKVVPPHKDVSRYMQTTSEYCSLGLTKLGPYILLDPLVVEFLIFFYKGALQSKDINKGKKSVRGIFKVILESLVNSMIPSLSKNKHKKKIPYTQLLEDVKIATDLFPKRDKENLLKNKLKLYNIEASQGLIDKLKYTSSKRQFTLSLLAQKYRTTEETMSNKLSKAHNEKKQFETKKKLLFSPETEAILRIILMKSRSQIF